MDFRKLEARGKTGATVIRLMMAANDLGFSNEALGIHETRTSAAGPDRRDAARRYFLRLQLSHLRQGMKVIGHFKNDPNLVAQLSKGNARTQENFERLCQLLPGGNQHKEFARLVKGVRDNVTFHYDETHQHTEWAIRDRASRPEKYLSSVTRGDHRSLWLFKAADEIVDSIVVRKIWGIPWSAEQHQELRKTEDQLFQMVFAFVDFVGEFVWKFLEG